MSKKDKNNLNNLTIIGDSWGFGAWSNKEGPLKNGDEYMSLCFKKYFNVKNLSVGGIGNSSMFDILKHEISFAKNNTKSFKKTHYLMIQSEPIRDIFPGINHHLMHNCDIFKKTDFKKYCETVIDIYYFNLNSLAIDNNIKINITGGCSDVSNLINKYSNLNVACESFYKLIDNNHQPSITSSTFDFSKILLSSSKSNIEVLDAALAKNSMQWDYREDLFGWYPDNHPSQKGIDIWVEAIYNKLV
tara:strand:- start:39 stop:773 length:735 start_codon:yes stop_codon:yes gene_type:complete